MTEENTAMAKVAATTLIKDPDGVTVKLAAGEECPDWALSRVATVGAEGVAPAPDAEVWVIRNGDETLGSRSRWVSSKGKPVTFANAEDAQARLEELLAEHPDANIEKVSPA